MIHSADNCAPRDRTGILIAAGILPAFYLAFAMSVIVDCMNSKEFFALLGAYLVTFPSSLAMDFLQPHAGEIAALVSCAVSNACVLFAVCYVAISICVSLWPSRRAQDGH